MNRMYVAAAAAIASVAGSAIASEVTLFSDNFDGYAYQDGNGYLNWNGAGVWAMSNGTVDLIGVGSNFDLVPGHGKYIDLDGSTNDPGRMTTVAAFNFIAGQTYKLSFKLAGGQRGNGDNSAEVAVGIGSLLSDTITLGQNDDFTSFTYTFTPTVSTAATASFSFEGLPPADNQGLLLDDVKLVQLIPLPGAAGLGMAGLLAIGARRRAR